MIDVSTQATILSRYLVSSEPSKQMIDLYAIGVKKSAASVDRLTLFAFDHPSLLGLLDGGLALIRPHHELRRRIFIMFAIAETQPQFADLFLPKQRPFWYIGVIFFKGAWSAVMVLGGVIVLKIGRFV